MSKKQGSAVPTIVVTSLLAIVVVGGYAWWQGTSTRQKKAREDRELELSLKHDLSPAEAHELQILREADVKQKYGIDH